MTTEKQDQETRLEFYNNAAVAKFVMAGGVPKTTGEFRKMVA